MEIWFRVDASVHLGTGHVMRCLTLADDLQKFKSHVKRIAFIMRELPGHLCEYVESKGFVVHRLPETVDGRFDSMLDAEETLSVLHVSKAAVEWLIVDHYHLDAVWEKELRAAVSNIMVIDDMADRRHDCDLLLDQNYARNMETRYDGLVPVHCLKLLGPRYALLRQEFKEARLAAQERERDGKIRRMLVFYGGSDPTNETAKALMALQKINGSGMTAGLLHNVQVDVIVGQANPNQAQIEELCMKPNADSKFKWNYHCQVENMAYYMGRADLCLGAGGASTWERLYLGLPSITTVIAENQAEITAAVAETGTIWHLGWHAEVSESDLAAAVKEALASPGKLKQMGDQALHFMGHGGCAEWVEVIFCRKI